MQSLPLLYKHDLPETKVRRERTMATRVRLVSGASWDQTRDSEPSEGIQNRESDQNCTEMSIMCRHSRRRRRMRKRKRKVRRETVDDTPRRHWNAHSLSPHISLFLSGLHLVEPRWWNKEEKQKAFTTNILPISRHGPTGMPHDTGTCSHLPTSSSTSSAILRLLALLYEVIECFIALAPSQRGNGAVPGEEWTLLGALCWFKFWSLV